MTETVKTFDWAFRQPSNANPVVAYLRTGHIVQVEFGRGSQFFLTISGHIMKTEQGDVRFFETAQDAMTAAEKELSA